MSIVPDQIAALFDNTQDVFSNVRDIVQTAESVYDTFKGHGEVQVPPGIVDKEAAKAVPATNVSYEQPVIDTKTVLIIAGVALVVLLLK